MSLALLELNGEEKIFSSAVSFVHTISSDAKKGKEKNVVGFNK